MYHKDMTIKRRLFISNIRMIFISFVAFGFAIRMVTYFLNIPSPTPETIEKFHFAYNSDTIMIMMLMAFAIFIIIISIVNNFYTHHVVERIIKTLEPLNNGVQQIQNNNLSYRIEYNNDDEFRPICNAFNEMAEKLETLAIKQKKDEANRKELIAGISHDLRTPLTSIKGCLEGIETGVASTPEKKEKYFEFIKNKTDDLERIIEQLFLFSKLDMDEFPLDLRHVDITRVIIDIIEECTSEYSDKGLSIEYARMPDNLFVNVDVLMLRNVIINILENSVKYKVKEQGKIVISILCVKNSVVISLEDDGPGVQPEMLPKLFDVFYRTDPSRSRQGSGLGLAISLKIIESMNGSICAQLPDSGGLAIIIKLPLLQEETLNA